MMSVFLHQDEELLMMVVCVWCPSLDQFLIDGVEEPESSFHNWMAHVLDDGSYHLRRSEIARAYQ
jgi:hypothetical protein